MIVFMLLISDTCDESLSMEAFCFQGGVVTGVVNAAFALRCALVSIVIDALDAAKAAKASLPVNTLRPIRPFEKLLMSSSSSAVRIGCSLL